MAFWNKRIVREKTTLLVDIRNAYVQIAVISIKNNTSNILSSKKYLTSSSTNLLSVETLKKHLNDSLLDFTQGILPTLASEKKVAIKDILVVFSAPWYEAKITHLSFSNENPIVFSKEIYKNLINKDPVLSQNSENLLEKEVTHVLLNDYAINNPIGKLAKKVDMAFYVSHLDNTTHKIIKEVFDVYFPKKNLEIHSSCFVNFNTIRDLFINLSNFVFIDISASVTEIGIVKNDVLETILTIPVGKNSLLEAVSNSCKLNQEQLTSSLNILASGDLDESCSSGINELMNKEGTKWSEKIGEVLNKNTELSSLPNKVFLLSDIEVEPLIKMLFKSENIQKEIFKNSSSNIITLTENNFNKEVKSVSTENGIKNNLLLIKALFVKAVDK